MKEKKTRNNKIIAKYISGETRSSIGRDLGISKQRVNHIMNRLADKTVTEKFVYQDLVDLENIRLRYAKREEMLRGLSFSIDVYRSFLFKIKKGKPIQANNKVKVMFAQVARQIAKQSLKQIEDINKLIDTIDNRS